MAVALVEATVAVGRVAEGTVAAVEGATVGGGVRASEVAMVGVEGTVVRAVVRVAVAMGSERGQAKTVREREAVANRMWGGVVVGVERVAVRVEQRGAGTSR